VTAISTTAQIEDLIQQMSLAEKIGQMTQVEKGSIRPGEVADLAIGSVLSGGGGNPTPNNPATWSDMVDSFVEASVESRLGIPLIYGVDAVHGHSNVRGATILPHNIGLGASGDADLVEQAARVTAIEMTATGARWNFAPSVAVPHDIRWGRTYEGFARDPGLVSRLGVACLRGLQGTGTGSTQAETVKVLACPKHYLGDGATGWGTTPRLDWVDFWDAWGETWQIDQGMALVDEKTLRAIHLPPYIEAIEAGAMSVMASYSSWGGTKLHGHGYLLTGLLKDELAFDGFLVSDWMGIQQIDPDYGVCVSTAINAGLDMVMVPFDFRRFIDTLSDAVANGSVPITRVDDAVRRILRAKAAIGLFGDQDGGRPALSAVGSQSHRDVARRAVGGSAVLLKNERGLLPITMPGSLMLAGEADDLGLQCGGWTIDWQGGLGPITDGTTLLQALRSLPGVSLTFNRRAEFDQGTRFDLGVVVIAEPPYAEGRGDRADLSITADDVALFERVRSRCERVVVVVYSGRPLVMTELIQRSDAVIAAWLPGTEAAGLVDVLVGARSFSGRLPQPWPRAISDLGANQASQPLFPVGFGITT
jgi:beta-glucosidase